MQGTLRCRRHISKAPHISFMILLPMPLLTAPERQRITIFTTLIYLISPKPPEIYPRPPIVGNVDDVGVDCLLLDDETLRSMGALNANSSRLPIIAYYDYINTQRLSTFCRKAAGALLAKREDGNARARRASTPPSRIMLYRRH